MDAASGRLTLGSGLVASLLSSDDANILPALGLLPLWLIATVGMAGVWIAFIVLRMMRAGVPRPSKVMWNWAVSNRGRVAFMLAAVLLAGLNMITFMWFKPMLNEHVAFWADPLLAQADWYLFFGRDPWTMLAWLNSEGTAIFYHRAWFGLMILCLLIVLWQPPTPERNAVLLTYFLLWSVVGPVIHMLLPAGGPVFFERLGYGDRFAELVTFEAMTKAADMLWSYYSAGGYGPGAGISAMPSLHIATTVWMILAVRSAAPMLTAVFVVAGLLIFALSISLGWHYAVDGLVGGIAAWAVLALCRVAYASHNSIRAARLAAG